MFTEAKCQFEQIKNFLDHIDHRTNGEIKASLESIRDSVSVYRQRIAAVEENPSEQFNEYYPDLTVMEGTVDSNNPTDLKAFKELVDKIEGSMEPMRQNLGWFSSCSIQ